MRVAFRLDLPHGRCVAIAIPEHVPADSLSLLHERERELAVAMPEGRRATWVAGRIALRAALADVGIAAGPLLATDRGAPLVPDQALGSISHKRTLAVALAAPRTPGLQLGVDLEEAVPPRFDISRRVLTAAELDALEELAPEARGRQVVLRLSAKEAIYKALDPFVRRYVSFQEAELALGLDGSAEVTLAVKEGPFAADLWWREIEGFFLTSVAVRRAPP